MKIETWFRIVLALTGVMNIFGGILFVPGNPIARNVFLLPEGPSMYLWILAIWIFAFGVCYLWMAVTGSRERLFIAIGATGKISFSAVLFFYAANGFLPWQTASAGFSDFILGAIFLVWLFGSSKNRSPLGRA